MEDISKGSNPTNNGTGQTGTTDDLNQQNSTNGVPIQFIPPVPPPSGVTPLTSSSDNQTVASVPAGNVQGTPAIMNSTPPSSEVMARGSIPAAGGDAGSPQPTSNLGSVNPLPQSSTNQQVNPDDLLTDKSYPDDLDLRWNSWKCLNCGYYYEGHEVLTTCPRCGNDDPDKFD